MSWLNRIKLRVLAAVLGIPLTAAALVIMLSPPLWLTWPIVGAAVAAVGMSIDQMTRGLAGHRCYHCGATLDPEQATGVGVVCSSCGSLNQHRPSDFQA